MKEIIYVLTGDIYPLKDGAKKNIQEWADWFHCTKDELIEKMDKDAGIIHLGKNISLKYIDTNIRARKYKSMHGDDSFFIDIHSHTMSSELADKLMEDIAPIIEKYNNA